MESAPNTVEAVGAVPSLLAGIGAVLSAFPVVAFAGMGLIGGLAGWALALDRGTLDNASVRAIGCFLGRRVLLGLCIGISAAVWWSDYGTSLGAWLIATSLIAIDPVGGVAYVWSRALTMLPTPRGKGDNS